MSSERVAVQSRAFDILYNMAVRSDAAVPPEDADSVQKVMLECKPLPQGIV